MSGCIHFDDGENQCHACMSAEVAALKAQLAEADAKLTLATDTLVKLSLDGLIATRDTASHALLRIEAIAKARAMAKGAT